MKIFKALTVAATVALAGSAYAADLTVPHSFSSGTTIKSSDMNENFSTIYQKYNDLQNNYTALDKKFKMLSMLNAPNSSYTMTNPNNSHVYKEIKLNASWDDAVELCKTIGGHLITITSKSESDWLWDNFNTTRSRINYYIGATDEGDEGNWRWITGETWDYTSWDGPPDNHGGNQHWAVLTYWLRGKNWDDGGEGSDIIFGDNSTGPDIHYPICEFDD